MRAATSSRGDHEEDRRFLLQTTAIALVACAVAAIAWGLDAVPDASAWILRLANVAVAASAIRLSATAVTCVEPPRSRVRRLAVARIVPSALACGWAAAVQPEMNDAAPTPQIGPGAASAR